METAVRISHTSALILQTIRSGYIYGFDIMEVTGLPSGTIYPALRRLEKDSLVRGDWEDTKIAFARTARPGVITSSPGRAKKRWPARWSAIPCWPGWRLKRNRAPIARMLCSLILKFGP